MQRFSWFAFAVLILSLTTPRFAIAVTQIPEIGPHHLILVFEKSENPQNILIAYTKLTDKCEPLLDSNKKPTFDFYWLMDKKRYKPVHTLIKSGIRERISVEPGAGNSEFYIRLQDIQEIKHDLKDPRVFVRVKTKEQGCELEVTMTLGPSNEEKVLRVRSIYSESKKTLIPPFRKLVSVTLRGEEVKTGKPLEKTYFAK